MIYEGKQKIWKDYQKEIPDDHWYFVRSCIRQNFFPASERMFTEITRNVLGKMSMRRPTIPPAAASPTTATRFRRKRP